MKTEMLNGKTILIIGSCGFILKNLIWELRSKGYEDLRLFDLDTDPGLLDALTKRLRILSFTLRVNARKRRKSS